MELTLFMLVLVSSNELNSDVDIIIAIGIKSILTYGLEIIDLFFLIHTDFILAKQPLHLFLLPI